MLPYITSSASIFLIVLGLVLIGRSLVRMKDVLIALATGLGLSAMVPGTWLIEQVGMQSAMAVGFAPLLLLVLLALVTRTLQSKGLQVHRWMISMGLAGWLVAHAAFIAVEKTWLAPRWSEQQARAFTWVGQLKPREQTAFCNAAQLICKTTGDGSLVVVDPLSNQAHETAVIHVLQAFSAAASLCWSIGILVPILGHRRKRHV